MLRRARAGGVSDIPISLLGAIGFIMTASLDPAPHGVGHGLPME